MSYGLCDEAMQYIYPRPQSVDDARRSDVIYLMHEALKRTEYKYGLFVLRPADVDVNYKRAIQMIRKEDRITVAWFDTTKQLEQTLLPVLIPIQKGIVGYRVLLIRSEDKDKFVDIDTVEELRQYKNGLVSGWVNEAVMTDNELPYVTSINYEDLFRMLAVGRFDYFSRGVVEAYAELEDRIEAFPNLMVEKHILLHYAKPMYLFTSKNRPVLNKRLTEGLLMLIEDGSFEKIFCQFHGDSIRNANLNERVNIQLKSNLLLPSAPTDKKFWLDLTVNSCQQH
ncbi:hypothetical protein A9Q78_08635 [Methylophaga sp. 41_12_T18]|nr:hypothetical protein A9Q78_08635 [Methylophaga sp. 41_12_T18]